jgi:hypothetical protein
VNSTLGTLAGRLGIRRGMGDKNGLRSGVQCARPALDHFELPPTRSEWSRMTSGLATGTDFRIAGDVRFREPKLVGWTPGFGRHASIVTAWHPCALLR